MEIRELTIQFPLAVLPTVSVLVSTAIQSQELRNNFHITRNRRSLMKMPVVGPNLESPLNTCGSNNLIKHLTVNVFQDPCCPQKHYSSLEECWQERSNPCHAAASSWSRQCTFNRSRNIDFVSVALNRWNVSCVCDEVGYKWDSTFGICIGNILEYTGGFINRGNLMNLAEPNGKCYVCLSRWTMTRTPNSACVSVKFSNIQDSSLMGYFASIMSNCWMCEQAG
jgi:hypothetical protein